MKKLVSILLIALMLVSLIPALAFANDDCQIVAAASDSAPHAGDDVTVTISIEHNPGFVGYELGVSYDEAVLEWTGAAPATELAGYEASVSSFELGEHMFWTGIEDVTGDVDLLVLTFHVKDDATVGSASDVLVSIEQLYADKGDYDDIAATVKGAAVTVTSNRRLGDINGDGRISIRDVNLMMAAVRDEMCIDAEQWNEEWWYYDMNGDHRITIRDVNLLMAILRDES